MVAFITTNLQLIWAHSNQDTYALSSQLDTKDLEVRVKSVISMVGISITEYCTMFPLESILWGSMLAWVVHICLVIVSYYILYTRSLTYSSHWENVVILIKHTIKNNSKVLFSNLCVLDTRISAFRL
jgi:hypothetical protein